VDAALITRRVLTGALGLLAVLAVGLVVLVAAAALVDANHFRGPLLRFIVARIGRPIRVEGSLEAHLLSLTPWLSGEGVTIENPPWMPPGTTAQIGRLSLSFQLLPLLSRSFVIQRLVAQAATLHLVRDAEGRANWQSEPPGTAGGTGPPLIHSLSLPNARIDFDDAQRHLKFTGSASAQDAPGPGDLKPLQIEGAGMLNGRAASFAINADALATVRADQPYRFAFDERSSRSRLSGRGSVPQPFDFRSIEVSFEAAGEDLKDLYFLVGLTMPDTGPYRFSGKLTRHGRHFQYGDLLVSSGQSDVRGTIAIESSHSGAKIDAELSSQLLRVADLGARAAHRAAEPPAGAQLLLPDIALPVAGIRRGDAVVNFHAARLEVGRLRLHDAAAHVTIDHGVLTIAPLSASIADGKLTGRASFDATHELPSADVDLSIANLRLGQFDRKGSAKPPFDGLLQARLDLKGHGSSIHRLAASSNGTVTAVLPQGAIRASFAELTGMDLVRGLGLMLRKDQDETVVRCALASFQVRDGTMSAQNLVIDSEPVLISGTGQIHLDTEALDIALHGQPKSRRLLRLHSPVLVRGTLTHPTFGIEARDTVGIVLAPVTAAVALVHPDIAKDTDCAALLAQGRTLGVASSEPTAAP
jgi:hypothetical protein